MTPRRVKIDRRHKDPKHTKRVCRPSKFGNKFVIGKVANFEGIENILAEDLQYTQVSIPNNEIAVRLFQRYQLPNMNCDPLRGFNLGCYCKLDLPCHADLILIKVNEFL